VRAAREWAAARGLARLRVRTNVLRAESPRFYAALGFRETKQQRLFTLEL
jgi:hypothetical protein